MKKLFVTATIALALASPARADATNEEKAGGMIGMLGYVGDHCPDLQSDSSGVRQALAVLGARGPDDLITGPAMRSGRLVREAYQAHPASEICPVLLKQFGPDGSVVPGLLRQK